MPANEGVSNMAESLAGQGEQPYTSEEEQQNGNRDNEEDFIFAIAVDLFMDVVGTTTDDFTGTPQESRRASVADLADGESTILRCEETNFGSSDTLEDDGIAWGRVDLFADEDPPEFPDNKPTRDGKIQLTPEHRLLLENLLRRRRTRNGPLEANSTQNPEEAASNETIEEELDEEQIQQFAEIVDDPEFFIELEEDEARDSPRLSAALIGEFTVTECGVCLETQALHRRTCCNFPVCDACLKQYFTTQVLQGIVKLYCCSSKCQSTVSREEIIFRLDEDARVKFHRYLLEANREPHVKTCPRCSEPMTVEKHMAARKDWPAEEAMVRCTECNLVWCFPCHAPWHVGVNCRLYQKGDKLLKVWAKEQCQGQVNAQRCPKCKIYIQRTSGCDHMTCTRCKTEFCYRCGDRFRDIRFMGNHYTKLSVFGCKYLYKAEKPVQRKMIRGAVLGGQLVAAPVLAGLAVGAGSLLVGVGTFVLPVYGGYRLFKKYKAVRAQKKRRRFQRRLRSQGRLEIVHPHLERRGSDPYARFLNNQIQPVGRPATNETVYIS
ncbi:PREDICTED: E3 ubiquitin-protein ligase RNF19B-like [Branchiostoma belcheri]|uniref:RBR-type E3 ubiquitin transferase n=1 Tax=Branchiostoma belcheri TaxID=7741 RepID=A0A6P4ZT73_BRABE|nr:PREDICTED: E3 ubiquitin-protein ligase RNF19B-like [Branchiostoma belcheri]